MGLFDKVIRHVYWSPFCTIDLVQDEHYGFLAFELSCREGEWQAENLQKVIEKSGLYELQKAIVKKELNLISSYESL